MLSVVTMAYTLHWSNHTTHLIREQESGAKSDVLKNTSLDYREKIGTLTPALNLTADVLYPNALSAVCTSNFNHGGNETTKFCKGNQLDQSYPLQQKLPSCVPLVQVQYNGPTNSNSTLLPLQDEDMCAKPVLNWESYIRSLKDPLLHPNSGSAKLKTSNSCSDTNIKNTFNVLYNSHGACDWTFDSTSSSKDGRVLLVGKAESLRAVRLKRCKPAELSSYCVAEVLDELPSHLRANNGDDTSDQVSLDRLIFQIVAHRKESIAAVRRGTSIDLYNTRDNPLHLSTIPVYGYSATEDRKHGMDSRKKTTLCSSSLKPKFLSVDLNVFNPCEIVTLDENRVIQFHDIVSATSSAGIHGAVNCEVELSNSATFVSNLTMNHAAGLLYANDSCTLYFYDQSQIFLYDKRERIKIMGVIQTPQFHSLLNLRNDVSAHAISDQRYFTSSNRNKSNLLTEHVTCVQRSVNSNYYYVGTTYRIFLMDWRVPSHPVLKMSHGMRSSASYIDTKHNKNFEVIIAGSQRNSEIFSAVIDYAHVSCESRSTCSVKNPILQSYPRHLSSPKDFIDVINNHGFHFAWEKEHSQIVSRSNAWCTGLSICDLPINSTYCISTKPPGNIVISTNNYGDIFYQEWLQKPVETQHLIHEDDHNWIEFVNEWKSSAELKFSAENLRPKPSQSNKLPENCSLAVEPSVELMKMIQVKESTFNNLDLNLMQYEYAKETVSSVQDSSTSLKKFKGSRVNTFLDVWEHDWECKEDIVSLANPRPETAGESQTLNMNVQEFDSTLTVDQSKESYDENIVAAINPENNVDIKLEVESPDGDHFSDADMFSHWLP